MKRTVMGCTLAVVAAALVAARPAEAQDLQQEVAAAKQAAAQNQQALRSYSWVEKTEICLKGEVKSTRIESCRYGSDGKVLKTPMSEAPAPQKKQRHKVTLNVQMQSLADGTDYAGTVVLAIPSSNIQVRITNSNYQKLAQ
jgi:hypothetical protein